MVLNETHDPELRSWVDSANQPGNGFPVQNLPFCVFRPLQSDQPFRGGVGIGDFILDLAIFRNLPALRGTAMEAAVAACHPKLNALMNLGSAHWSALRLSLSRILRTNAAETSAIAHSLIRRDQAEYDVPVTIGDFTDFYTSIHHATTVGKMFRPENPLMPNYKWLPVAYHGRTSSIGVTGQQFIRPYGQIKLPDQAAPLFATSRQIDYELELGIFVGPGNSIGHRIPIDSAESHVFGLCVLNDWSARDIQSWEYQPLGPFLGKNFATTISPWIVTLEALEPFRAPYLRAETEPQPLSHLASEENLDRGALDIEMEVCLVSAEMRKSGLGPSRLSSVNYRHAYWTLRQMIAHHTSNGCNLRAGDLIGTGTQSGPAADQVGSMLELTKGGREPVKLPNGEIRGFIADSDTIVMRAWCEREGYPRIAFGECSATLLPA